MCLLLRENLALQKYHLATPKLKKVKFKYTEKSTSEYSPSLDCIPVQMWSGYVLHSIESDFEYKWNKKV